MQIKVKFAIVSAIFDYNPKISAAIKPEYWEKCMPHVEELLKMVDENREEVTTGDGIGKVFPNECPGLTRAFIRRKNVRFMPLKN